MKFKYLLLFLLLTVTYLHSKNLENPNIGQCDNEALRSKTKNPCSLTVKNQLTTGQLCVNGNSCLHNVTVTGTETVNGTLNVNGSLFVNGTQITNNCPPNCQINTPAVTTTNAIVLFADPTGRNLIQSPAPVTIDPANSINNVNNITMAGNLNMVNTSADFAHGVIN